MSELIGKGILFEAYCSSSIGFGFGPLLDDNVGLFQQVAVADLKPVFISPLNVATRHSAAIWTYFWSMAFTTPTVNGRSRRGLSASAADGALKAWMSSTQKQLHSLGVWTKAPQDDAMNLASR